jgi:ABC-type antimicrobial peptide transport system permease subunit
MQLANSQEAIGKAVTIDGRQYSVIGVVEDFHYERINYPIQNFAFRYDPTRFEILNLKFESTDMAATVNKIKTTWQKFDPVHSFNGKFYQDYLHDAYEKLSWIIRIVAFVALLAISIASLGLLGMVIFTTEKRLKEISIRKVLGASEAGLVMLMGRGFFVLLMISSAIAIPCAYYFMDRIVFGKIVYRASIGVMDLLLGTIFIMGIAILMIAVQTLKTAKTNPAQTLRTE